jgi:hypothetical protein
MQVTGLSLFIFLVLFTVVNGFQRISPIPAPPLISSIVWRTRSSFDSIQAEYYHKRAISSSTSLKSTAMSISQSNTPKKNLIIRIFYGFIQFVINSFRSFLSFLGLIKPNTVSKPHQIDPSFMLFINRKSGGKNGKILLQKLSNLIIPQKLCDLLYEHPGRKLYQQILNQTELLNQNQTSSSILNLICCGGDGTIRWIMDEAYKLQSTFKTTKYPSSTSFSTSITNNSHSDSDSNSGNHHNNNSNNNNSNNNNSSNNNNNPLSSSSITLQYGIMPLGTGNDLYHHLLQSYYPSDRSAVSRIHYALSSSNQLMSTMTALSCFQLPYAQVKSFDRWCIRIHRLSSSASTVTSDTTNFTSTIETTSSNTNNIGHSESAESADTSTSAVLPSLSEEMTTPSTNALTEYDGNHPLSSLDTVNETTTAIDANTNSNTDSTTTTTTSATVISSPSTISPILTQPLQQLQSSSSSSSSSSSFPLTITFNNYFGIGIDGDITCTYDHLRQQRPELFFHRLMNKVWFGIIWIYKFCRENRKELSKDLILYCDDQLIDLTMYPSLKGIIIANIVSYAGGTRLWPNNLNQQLQSQQQSETISSSVNHSNNEGTWKSQSSEDGIIEVSIFIHSLYDMI